MNLLVKVITGVVAALYCGLHASAQTSTDSLTPGWAMRIPGTGQINSAESFGLPKNQGRSGGVSAGAAVGGSSAGFGGGATERQLSNQQKWRQGGNLGRLVDEDDRSEQELKPDNQVRIQPSEFERFVQATTGQVVAPYGQSLFRSGRFGAVSSNPVPADYLIGPDDELQIRIWGNVDFDGRMSVDRNGQISLPKVGTFSVAGTKAADLEKTLRTQVGKYFTNFQLSASIGRMRSMQVYVVGQAAMPGLHVLPGYSTLIAAIFQVGLPGTNGSYRKIQLKRQNRIIAELDLYEFIAKGDSSKDVRLASGDVIVVTPAGPRVAVLGTIDNPGIFEIKPGEESLATILTYAGNQRNFINSERVQLQRIDSANPKAPRLVEDIPLRLSSTQSLMDSDIITTFPASPQFGNAVTLRGNVAIPLRHPYKAGMRVRDLIPDKEALITYDYYLKKNSLVQFIGAERQALTQQSTPRKNSSMVPSRRSMDDNSEATSNSGSDRDLVQTGDDRFETEIRRGLDEVNFDYAVVERLNKDMIRSELIPFNLNRAFADKSSPDNLELKPGDVVTIFGVKDIAAPKAKRSAYVRITGEVNAPGIYSIEPGTTLRQLIRQAGGFSHDAFEYGLVINRESTRVDQERRYQEAINRLERDLQQVSVVQAQNVLNAEDVGAKARQSQATRLFLEKLRAVKPTGRVILDIPADASRPEDIPDFSLEDGDSISVPAVPNTVSVYGAVFGEGSYLFNAKRSIGDYLTDAGGATRGADPGSVFVIRANGSIISRRRQTIKFIGGLESERALPGDTVFVPEDFERQPMLKMVRDIATVFSQFGLGAAAIKVLK